MNIENLCVNCMHETFDGESCTNCDFNKQTYQPKYNHLPMGRILYGKYLVGEVLGEGGFGITYLGFDLKLEIKVAIKEYYPNGLVTRENNTTVHSYTGEKSEYFQKGKQRFLDEAKTLAKFMNKPGVVSVNDFFAENSTVYIVMEYIDGVTLKQYLAKMNGRLPSKQVFEMMQPVIKTLGEIHKTGTIHRDISPDNLMITNDGEVKLLDFGAARDFSESGDRSLSVMLKPGYAPEEQYRTRGKQGPWTDIYALCATMYKCITGIIPDESSQRMRKDELQPPSQFSMSITTQEEKVLLKGLAVIQEDRYHDVQELYEDLYAKKNDNVQPIKKKDPPNDKSTQTNVKDRGNIILAVLIAGVLLAGLISINIYQGQVEQSEDEEVSTSTENLNIEESVSVEDIIKGISFNDMNNSYVNELEYGTDKSLNEIFAKNHTLIFEGLDCKIAETKWEFKEENNAILVAVVLVVEAENETVTLQYDFIWQNDSLEFSAYYFESKEEDNDAIQFLDELIYSYEGEN